MVEVKKYHLPPTALMPNSPHPLLHYKGVLSKEECSAARVHDLYTKNEWETQWIFRYGETQRSHYHSQAHECMTVLTGSATVRFGVADTVDDMEENTHGSGKESGGIELQANAGDVFVLPAGLAHKTYNASPVDSFILLSPGSGHGIPTEDVRATLENIELSGFTMIGAYPKDSGPWDFAKGGENEGEYEKVWSVPKPQFDPILGDAKEGLCGTWE